MPRHPPSTPLASPASGPPRTAALPPAGDAPRPRPPLDFAELGDLIVRMRERVPAASSRRIGQHHAAVLLTLRALQGAGADVHAIYKALLDQGHDVPLSTLYRALKVLEAAGMVQREWVPHEGRPRGVYVAVEEQVGDAAPAKVCAHCGASLPEPTP
ncbi:transcriptional repressor [Variovorax sp. ZT4R33]|uniref:transcriptional repressor n=1 Tax=Variovorax sp. ZT4R33 TaxID=3443743 RepID=UPI003F48906B